MLFIRRRRAKFKIFLGLLLSIYLLVGIGLYLFQEKMIFLPTELDKDYRFNFDHNFHEVFLNTEDEAKINALYFEAENPRGVILYFHGNAGNLARWGKIVSYYVDLRYDVFVMDYRTYGKSSGKISEDALYKDAQLCYEYLTRDYDEKDIIVYGRSLGTGLAAYVASRNNPKHLILETPYYNLIDIAKSRFPIYPIAPLMRYKFPTNEFLKGVKCNVTMFHGTTDKVIPLASAEKLFTEIDLPNTRLNIIEYAGHNNLIEFDDFRQAIELLLD